MGRFFKRCGVLFSVWLVVGCDDTPASGPSADILSIAVDASDDSNFPDTVEDISPDKAACQGSALDPAMSAFDGQCGFLEKCLHAGSCFCGDGCPANKTKCDDAFCPSAHPKCYCGPTCDAKVVMCPNYICTANPSTGCDAHDDCVFNAQKPPAWCGCQKMPDHCSCGSDCGPNVPLCDAKVCKNYPAKGCSANTTSYTNCYCDRCGLLGPNPKCWFVLCPGAKT